MKNEIKKLGRPVNENSKRQIELKEKAELRSKGLLKRGRPVVENSKNQLNQERKQMLRIYGAELIEVPDGKFDDAIALRDKMAEENGYFKSEFMILGRNSDKEFKQDVIQIIHKF